MDATVKKMQPLSFYKPSETPDWLTYWPNMDNVYHRERWINNLYPANYYLDWLINKEISLQLRVTDGSDSDLSLYKYNESTESYDLHTTVSAVDITPTGWVSEDIYRYNYTPTETGVYYFDSASADLRTNKFVVVQSEKYRRRLIQIAYYNTYNDYGIVFWDGTTQRYNPSVYFTGALYPEAPGNEISAFETDRGEISKQRSTPKELAVLRITDIHYTELPRINLIFANDRLTINGITYQTTEAPNPEPINNSDLYNVEIKLTRTNYEY